MELAPLFLGLINLVVLIVVVVKLGKISRQIEIPIVKKLTPELKLKPAKHRMNKAAVIGSEAKQVSPAPRQPGNRNKPNSRTPDSEGRNNRRRRNPKNRFESSKEVLSNQEAGKTSEEVKQGTVTKVENTAVEVKTFVEKAPVSVKPVVEKSEANVATETSKPTRRPLAPRGTDRQNEVAAPTATSNEAPKASVETSESDVRKIRHGRRNQVKKAPVIED